MESSGETGGKRKSEEEDAGEDFIGTERSGTARGGPILPADTWGEGGVVGRTCGRCGVGAGGAAEVGAAAVSAV
uniref:DUF834 domain-containing protein n=1 Tax=Oryza meridionalis TaxID=40149 RepID=A0A0E0CSG6_9ORYZ